MASDGDELKRNTDASIMLRDGTDDDVPRVLDVLRKAYGSEGFGEDWHRWKHRDCPWGASRLVIAEEDGVGLLGLFFSLPWPYLAGGDRTDGRRLVDGAVLPAARGKRVLGRVVGDELDRWHHPERPGVLLATATPEARKSHERNGATTLSPFASAYGIPRSLRPAKLIRGDEVLDSFEPQPGAELRTAWSPDTLRWRTDERSGHRYEAASLAAGDGANGLIYRINSKRGLRTLCPLVAWGAGADKRRLVGATAIATGSVAVLAPTGVGTADFAIRPLRPSGQTIMCVWDERDPATLPRATTASSWALSMAELEGLI